MAPTLLTKLQNQVHRLRGDVTAFDKAKWFDKNRYMKNKHGLFERTLFSSHSMLLSDYLDETEQAINRLPSPEQRHEYRFAVERIAAQLEAIVKVLKSTPVWAKENKPQAKAKVYRKALEQIVRPTHELYQELAQNHDFERRLLAMIEERKIKMDGADATTVSALNGEVLALHARLGRCRKAISNCEDKIQQAEKRGR